MTVLERALRPTEAAAGNKRELPKAAIVAAALACLGWAPFVTVPASPDEGGFLLIASQWRPGTSLYGDYWVDRPPLLFLLHEAAAALGGIDALRLIGIAGVVSSIFLTLALVRSATRDAVATPSRLALLAPIVLAAVYLTTPLFGTTQVDGELLSIPFVMGGLVALVRAFAESDTRRSLRWAIGAGVLACSAAMVKQNAVDVFVVLAITVVAGVLGGDRRRAARIGATCLTAATATLGAFLALAAVRGTNPTGLWDAVVTFRFQAATVIHQSANNATSMRITGLLEAAAISAAPIVIALFAWQVLRRRATFTTTSAAVPDLRWPALGLLAWEVVAVAAGGSYWLHYLLVLVPGIVLLSVAAAQRPPALQRTTVGVLAWATVSATVAVVVALGGRSASTSDTAVSAYLRAHAQPTDTAVVTFGHPNILWDSGLRSPYSELWSLPVRVRDNKLVGLDAVLQSPQAPSWLVVSGTSIGTWGVDARQADQLLHSDYRQVAQFGKYYIWERISAGR